MATIANIARPHPATEDRFFLVSAVVMALTIVLGFSAQLAMGRSSFQSPPLVHAHAIVFMGWVVLYLLQNVFVATGNRGLHRQLGWIGTGWMVAMVVLGFAVTAAMVRRGQVPFFFRPQQFLIFDPVSILTFAGLTIAAVMMRRQTEWHRRLHFCAMTILLGPAFGRLEPGPLLAPWAWEAVFATTMLFPIAGMIHDLRRSGRVHPAWSAGIATLIGCFVLIEAVTYSPVGDAIYRGVTAGSPGASVAGLDFPPPPSGRRITGRTSG